MYNPKPDINTILKSVSSGVAVHQSRPEKLEVLPCFTFIVPSDVPTYDLDNTIALQDIDVQVDIWTETSKESSTLKKALVSTMRSYKYMLSFSGDVPDDSDEKISHVTTLFKLLK